MGVPASGVPMGVLLKPSSAVSGQGNQAAPCPSKSSDLESRMVRKLTVS